MDSVEFLFPRDLEVNSTSIRQVLIIGSCLSESYALHFRRLKPEITFDHILFNNFAPLPKMNKADLADYDLQYVQLPLREVLTDAVFDSSILTSSIHCNALRSAALNRLRLILDEALIYNKNFGILTLVSNFIMPQARMSPSLEDRFSQLDLTLLIDDLNRSIADYIRYRQNCYIADVDMLASSFGKRYFLDDSIVFYTHGAIFYPEWSSHERTPPWTAPERARTEDIPSLAETYESRYEDFFACIYRQLESTVRIVRRIDHVKLVIFDLDNTLWRGNISEHYVQGREWPYNDGWPLGIWEAVQILKCRGILVSIVSRNSLALVRSRWADVVSPPFVKFDDFDSPQISSQTKVEGIRKLLSITGASAANTVFVDSHANDRREVRATFPDIRVIGKDPFVVRRILLWSAETQQISLAKHPPEKLRSRQSAREDNSGTG